MYFKAEKPFYLQHKILSVLKLPGPICKNRPILFTLEITLTEQFIRNTCT